MLKGDSFQHNFTISPSVYQGFIHLFKDENPLHVNDNFAREKGFSSKVMHGNILNGFISFMIGECLPVKNVLIHSQTIDYKKPVYLGDELEMKLTVKEIHESVSAIELIFGFTNQQQQLVAKGKIQIGILK